jgi:predicted O-methyltransferase YrrM
MLARASNRTRRGGFAAARTGPPNSRANMSPGFLVYKIARNLRLTRLVKVVITPLPVVARLSPRLKRWLENQKLRFEIRSGMRLVPEHELQRCYTAAVNMLIDRHGKAGLGDYLEFGVYNGTSLACMHRVVEQLDVPNVRLFGFDSFEGLPESAKDDDGGVWEPGLFRSEIEFTRQFLTNAGVNWSRVHLIKGWFSDTCTQATAVRHDLRKASLIMVDCDMYLSTRDVLSFIEPLIGDEAIIFFDDWHSLGLDERNLGEKRAFDEFLHEHADFQTQELPTYSDTAKVMLLTRAAQPAQRTRTGE